MTPKYFIFNKMSKEVVLADAAAYEIFETKILQGYTLACLIQICQCVIWPYYLHN